jgi:hypothetical protein
MSGKAQHVAPNPRGGWSVRKTGATRATRVFSTESEALNYAREKAQEERGDLFVHRNDGTVRSMDRYGSAFSSRKR